LLLCRGGPLRPPSSFSTNGRAPIRHRVRIFGGRDRPLHTYVMPPSVMPPGLARQRTLISRGELVGWPGSGTWCGCRGQDGGDAVHGIEFPRGGVDDGVVGFFVG